jgi:hypothetical protein
MVKVIFWIVKAIAYIFIGTAQLFALVYYKVPKAIKIQFLRSKYFEERILLVVGIVIFMGLFFLVPPIVLVLKFKDLDWLFLLFATGAANIPMAFGLYYANHHNGHSSYVPGEVNDVSWGANTYIPDSHARALASETKNDPDFKAAMVEVDDHLNPEKNWNARMDTGSSKKRRG